MDNYKKLYQDIGIKIPKIMLPNKNVEMEKWAVIACDQFTSQRDYWKKVENLVSSSPTCLNLIFPECYLDDEDDEQRIESINLNMKKYISDKILSEPTEGFILIKRDTPKTKNRWGLIVAIDLEKYDFSKGSKSLIRATEGTILDRIPPRVKIRENAPLELPHIMVLIDDREKTIIEPLTEKTEALEKVYDFDLMMNSGHITGYRINSENDLNQIAKAFSVLASGETMLKKYDTKDAFLFAMGDGNHSLATAKTIWENYKKDNSKFENVMNHPSRWALVELNNIFSEGIEFEAIHRVLFNLDSEDFLKTLKNDDNFKIKDVNSINEINNGLEENNSLQLCGFVTPDRMGIIECLKPTSSISAGTFQTEIDNYLKKNKEVTVDYIHGIEVTTKLGKQEGNMGIFLPSIDKDSFFNTVIKDGAFPRKTFSMGEAFEKRFYIESRRIK